MKLSEFSKTARDHSRFSKYSALVFAASWGWGSGISIDAAGTLSGKSRGLAAKLTELGYLKIHEWQHSNHIKFYYTITKSGINHAIENMDWSRDFGLEYGYAFSPMPEKIPSFKSHSAVHDLYCQILCVSSMINSNDVFGRVTTYYATPDLYANYAVGIKVPDMIIERARSMDIIEFENSKKSKPELLNFVDHYYRWSGKKEGEKRRRLFVWSINRSIERQFIDIWTPGNMVAPFVRQHGGVWIQSSELGLRIEDPPLKRYAYFQTIDGGMDGLLKKLSNICKLKKYEIPVAEELDYDL